MIDNLFLNNGITLYMDDCFNVFPKIPDASIDMILCDLPYGTTKCKWDVIIPFEPMWQQLKRIIKENGVIALFGTQPFTAKLIVSNLKMYKYDWLWKKDKAANWMFGNKMPLKIYENISVFYEKQPTYNPQKIINPKGPSKRHLYKNPSKITNHIRDIMGEGWKETTMDDTQNYHGANYEPDKLLPTTEIYCAREQRDKVHPTQKPVKLLEYLIKTYTNKGETVLDFAMGSGSTGVACIRLNRKFIGMESEQKYFDIAKSRIEKELSHPLLISANDFRKR